MSAKTRPATPHQIAMVFDLNKCIGCQTCSVACKMLWTRDDDRPRVQPSGSANTNRWPPSGIRSGPPAKSSSVAKLPEP